MRVYELSDPDSMGTRSHPWSGSLSNSADRYLDLQASPELIRTSLEDLHGWEGQAAVETFFQLLEWLNGPESLLLSNDCAFNPPVSDGERLECSGRLMLLFRELGTNTSAAAVHGLTQDFARGLYETDPSFELGAVGASVVPVRFLELPGPAQGQQGQQLLISFWAWGLDVGGALSNLDRTFINLSSVLRSIAMRPAPPRD